MEFEELYTSKYSGQWHIEVLEGWNEATALDIAHITDGSTTWDQPRGSLGVVCCNSRHVWLTLDPVRIPYKLSRNRFQYANPEWHTLNLPSKPGKYEVYVTTQRVFGRDQSTTTYEGKGASVSSNIVTLEVK